MSTNANLSPLIFDLRNGTTGLLYTPDTSEFLDRGQLVRSIIEHLGSVPSQRLSKDVTVMTKYANGTLTETPSMIYATTDHRTHHHLKHCVRPECLGFSTEADAKRSGLWQFDYMSRGGTEESYLCNSKETLIPAYAEWWNQQDRQDRQDQQDQRDKPRGRARSRPPIRPLTEFFRNPDYITRTDRETPHTTTTGVSNKLTELTVLQYRREGFYEFLRDTVNRYGSENCNNPLCVDYATEVEAETYATALEPGSTARCRPAQAYAFEIPSASTVKSHNYGGFQ
ncbi:hypothetical protein P7C73_g2831, partial [Tremellales sp. Uapishka_1]